MMASDCTLSVVPVWVPVCVPVCVPGACLRLIYLGLLANLHQLLGGGWLGWLFF